jgi:hypothetical protein
MLLRNNNENVIATLDLDTGWDSIGDFFRSTRKNFEQT